MFGHGSAGLAELENFADFMCTSNEEFRMLYQKGIPQLTQTLSILITLTLRDQLRKDPSLPILKLVNILLQALSQQEVTLS